PANRPRPRPNRHQLSSPFPPFPPSLPLPTKIAGPAASVVPSKRRILESRKRPASTPEVQPRSCEEALGGGTKAGENAWPAIPATLPPQLQATGLRRLWVAARSRAAAWRLSASLTPSFSRTRAPGTYFQ